MHEESKQEYGTLIAKKSERLVTALYLVTDLMEDEEPIKHGLRKNSVTLLSSMNNLSQHDVKDRLSEFRNSLKTVSEIISLLHVTVTTGIISEMNGEILMEGFRTLQLVLEKKQPILTKEMLIIDNEDGLRGDSTFASAITSTSYDVLTPLTLSRMHERDTASAKATDARKDYRALTDELRRERLLSQVSSKDNKGHKIEESGDKKDSKVDSVIKDTLSTHSVLMEHAARVPGSSLASSFQMRKNSRREQILALFVKGVDVSIKDIATRIRGCSEKTIQRELNALLYDNFIERIGEKRWSRYILK
jgi:hypothetical protein